jgi:tRNA (guanine-N7-)-methyltransferase
LTKPVEVVDVGCGFGGLLFGLERCPTTQNMLMLGMEIRGPVTEYVRLKIADARAKATVPGKVRRKM